MSVLSQFEEVFGPDSDTETVMSQEEHRKTVDLDTLIKKLVEIRNKLKADKVPVYHIEFGSLTPIHSVTIERICNNEYGNAKMIVVID